MKIVEAWERPPVKQVVVLIYGLPATGKTTTAYSASRPVLLDFDQGADRAHNISKSVVINSWQDVSGIKQSELDDVDTVIVDTLGAAQDYLRHDIIRANPRHGRDGMLTLQGYGVLKARFTNWLAHLKSMGKDVVLIAHTEEERGNDDGKLDRIAMTGGSKEYVLRSTDAIGRLRLSNGRRVLTFEPSDSAIGKNPGGLPDMRVPSVDDIAGFLADAISKTKLAMNQRSQAKAEVLKEKQNVAVSFEESIQGMDLAQVNQTANSIKTSKLLDREAKVAQAGAIKRLAASRGWEYDPEAKAYVAASPPGPDTGSSDEEEDLFADDAEVA